jgi:lipopolysaccharide/colanic/teichoic acid biosynthesis glycosyltransferase
VVGPRPALPYQIDNYTDRQKQRLKVKPGITGWSQVKGRSSLTWPERIEQDLWYIDNWSLWLDIKIILITVKVVFERENLYKPPGYDPISGEMKILDSDSDES